MLIDQCFGKGIFLELVKNRESSISWGKTKNTVLRENGWEIVDTYCNKMLRWYFNVVVRIGDIPNI